MKKINIFLVLSLLLIITPGCMNLRKEYPDIKTYLLHLNRTVDSSADSSDIVLKIRRFDVSPRYESKSLIYRMNEFTYEADYYNRFLISPAIMLTQEVEKWLSASSRVKGLIDSRSSRQSDYTLEGRVVEFYGDFRDKNAAKAVIEIQMTLLNDEESPGEVAFQKTYLQEVALERASVSDLINGLNEGFSKIMIAFENDLGRLN
jgi:ABC-type uncharacterized transport system auxiliary subunit